MIPVGEYEAWSRRYQEAGIALEGREDLVEQVANELEQGLHLLGATAIEDRLQDGVPETIEDLKKAGIKLWVATGDKLETAIAIGRSTNLIATDSNIIIIRGTSRRPVHAQMVDTLDRFFSEHATAGGHTALKTSTEGIIPLQQINTGVSSIVGPENGERPGGFILVVDGAALLEAFGDEENKSILLRLAVLCDGVICCRVSPLQKALIVKLVKDGLGAMTLAIGDGANDVSMIQAADVGIGISGEEGMQAVNSSDYAIAQFRFLKKLLLVHGHWSYARNGMMLLNFFYKNIVSVGVLWWFQIHDAWSAYHVFDYVYILFWNSLWTVAAVVGIGLFDRFLEDSHTLMEVPELYRYGREGHWFGLRHFIIYMIDGVVQSAVIYFLILYTYMSPTAREDGYDVYLYEFSTVMAISAVLVANLFTGLNATAWTWWLFFAVFIGIIVQWVFTVIYSLVSPNYAVTKLYGNNYYLFHSAYFWLSLSLTVIIALAPRYLWKAWKFGFNPGDLEIFQLLQKNHSSISQDHKDGRRWYQDEVVRTDMVTGITSVDRGFDFATEEHGVEMQRVKSNLSERRMNKRLGFSRSPTSKGKSAFSSLSRAFLRKTASPTKPPLE
ncbi:hypothetical protein NLJ89_g8781 [Agrocybe chaxingu]|uniref:Phospholipid-transporting ATPase n=1 Tax=Agrocybe chaxingu TaxID=84603 RepID=A0A9W8K1T8_9AGAR|nr:hypothetical protein NLJ89_g8781 [Agrocybe chaxingu]